MRGRGACGDERLKQCEHKQSNEKKRKKAPSGPAVERSLPPSLTLLLVCQRDGAPRHLRHYPPPKPSPLPMAYEGTIASIPVQGLALILDQAATAVATSALA